MRIYTLPTYQGFRVYAEEQAYSRDDIYKIIVVSKNKVLQTGLQWLYEPNFSEYSIMNASGKVESLMDAEDVESVRGKAKEILKSVTQTKQDLMNRGPQYEKQYKQARKDLPAIGHRASIAFDLKNNQAFRDVLGPVMERIDALERFYKLEPPLEQAVRATMQTSETEKLFIELKKILQNQTTQTKYAPPNTGKQAIDTRIRQVFSNQEKAFLATDSGRAIDANSFHQAVDAVAAKYAEIVSENEWKRTTVHWESVEQIAKLICEVLFLASKSKTEESKRKVTKALKDLESVWPGSGGILHRIRESGGQLLKTLSTFCMAGDNYNADFKELMIVTHKKFRDDVVNALRMSVESCKTNTQCTAAFAPHAKLLSRITKEGAHLLGQPRTINDTLSEGVERFGPGEMSMAKDVILNSLSRKNYFDNPTGDDVPEKTSSEEASNKILNYIASYGKTGGLIDWPNTLCTLPNDWAHPGVILFGSIVLWVLARMVQTGER